MGEGAPRRPGAVLRPGAGRATSTSAYFHAFSCATFDSQGTRGAQVLVTAAGKTVRVVRTLAK